MTTRSTKMIPMGAGNNPTATASPNQSTPTKRKRSQPELPTVNPAPTNTSVIRKEINDFVKAVRGGGSSSSSSSSICNSTLTVPLAGKTDNNNPKTASTRTRRYTIKRHSRSVTATEPRRRPGSPRRITKTFEGDHPPRLPSPHFSELDLPSPSKKFRLADNNSNMTLNEDSGNQARNDQITNLQQQQQQRLMSLDQPMTLQAQQELNHSSPPSTPSRHASSGDQVLSSSVDDLPSTQYGPVSVFQSHEHYEHDDAEMEEILSHRVQHASTPINSRPFGHLAGSNSVLFPDSRNMQGHDSPGSSVNADISSSTWQASSSFSTHSGSKMNRGFSNHTSLTSNASIDLNALEDLKNSSIHASRLTSGCSMPSPRIRHTKILGSPRSSSRVNTLSASSFSSVGSLINTGLTTYGDFRLQPGAAYPRTLVKGATSSLSNLAPVPHPSLSDNDREYLTSDSDINHDETADIQIGRRIISHRPALASRRKVPLAEIIGRPLDPSPSISSLQSHLDGFRESNALNPSPSIGSIASAFVTGAIAPRDPASSTIESQSMKEQLKHQKNSPENDHHEESNFSVTNTSSSKNTTRSHLSNTVHFCHSPPSESASIDMTKSLPSPRDTRQEEMIVEVDEGADDSYEFLEREEAQGLAFETPNRKRKRLLHRSDLIHFRRPGLAAIDLSSSKLVDLPPNQSQSKPKTKVMQKLGLSRGHQKRPPTDHLQCPADTEDNVESPTKKIRVLQSEITRLRQELENEKTRSSRRNSMLMSLDEPDRRARPAYASPHVAFSPRSPMFASSPASASRGSSRRSHLLSPGREPTNSRRSSGMTDSPVVVKRPCDGASVGGSPFIVSRVFGQGPEVVGESTPAQAENSSGASAGRPMSAYSNASSGWNRDRELEADLFSSPRAKILKKMNRNSKIAPIAPRSNIRNMFRNSIHDFNCHGTPGSSSKLSAPGSQAPDMATFLNELRSSGRSKLRKTPGSAKYYNMQRSIGSPKSNYRKHQDPRMRRSVDCHNASLLSSVLQNYPPSTQHQPKHFDGSSSSRTSGRTQGTASSTNTQEADRPNTPPASKQTDTSNQCRSPLACKVYPSGNSTKPNVDENSDVQFVLGEAISTPRKGKRTGHLSRSLVDPHMTPRARGFTNTVQPTSPIQKDFTMDELIQQVKELKGHQDAEAGSPPVSQADNKLRNHDLLHEMGFCSSNENSLEVNSLSQIVMSGGSNPSTAVVSPVMNSPHNVYQETSRQRTSPMLKSLTQGRPKPKTSPTKTFLTNGNSNRWSNNSTIRLVSILNHSIDGMQVHQENGGENPAASLRTRPNERRVRILDDQTNLNRSRSSTASTGSNSRRHSMPAKPKQLASFAEDENEPPADTYYQHATQNTEDDEDQSWKAKSPSGSGWVVLKPDNDRSESAEPNLRRWSLRTSAILSAHPKLV
ncbi:hypothetical protein H4Q26_007422 [Puccinia striiformis f. sp. tritici PST-130]|nr:hypothetical protein H4Q26_007422 [Puccinia striiformis f. sp. tritici PST-130]